MAIQQGDVRVRKVRRIPQSATRCARTPRGYVLALGEATGHAHVITDEVEVYEAQGTLYLRTEAPVTIRHEEHAPVTIPPGTWQVWRVREKDHLADLVRPVVD